MAFTSAQHHFLKTLLAAPAASAFEGPASKVWGDQAVSYGANVERDPYGNTIAKFGNADGIKIMLAAHLDEMAMMVTHIDANGFLYVRGTNEGWLDVTYWVGQAVIIAGYNGNITGVIGKAPLRLKEAKDSAGALSIKDLWIDIGSASREETERYVRVGDPVTLEPVYRELLNGRIACKAMDDRIGAYIILEAAKRAAELGVNAQLLAVGTVKEVIGKGGMAAVGFSQAPDVGIVVDVTFATDIPHVNQVEEGEQRFGSGAVIAAGSAVHPDMFKLVLETARANGIPYIIEANPAATWTDADILSKVRGGVPTAVISVPDRYMHSAIEMIDPRDVESIIQLIVGCIKQLESSPTFAAKL
jgi:putative aminopeptidase FrvX